MRGVEQAGKFEAKAKMLRRAKHESNGSFNAHPQILCHISHQKVVLGTLAHSVSIHSGARDEVLCILQVLFRKFLSLGVTVIGTDLSTGQYPITVG